MIILPVYHVKIKQLQLYNNANHYSISILQIYCIIFRNIVKAFIKSINKSARKFFFHERWKKMRAVKDNEL